MTLKEQLEALGFKNVVETESTATADLKDVRYYGISLRPIRSAKDSLIEDESDLMILSLTSFFEYTRRRLVQFAEGLDGKAEDVTEVQNGPL